MGQMYSFTIVLIASTHFAPFVGFASSPFAAAGAGAGAVVSLSSDEESLSVSNMVSSPRAICAGASRVPLDFDTLCSLSLCLVAQTGAVLPNSLAQYSGSRDAFRDRRRPQY